MSPQQYANSLVLNTPGTSTKASPSDVRRNNRSLIFGLLFPDAQYSRAELGRITGLSRVAVSDVVSDMLDEGLIYECGYETKASGKGKRGTLLGIDPTRLRIVTVDLSQNHLIEGAVTDLLGNSLNHSEIALSAADHVDEHTIIGLIDKLITGVDHIIGIGIAATGVVQDGVIRQSTEFDWHDFDLKTPIEKRFGLPVIIANDVVCSMLTERFFGAAGSNMLFVKLDRGIGAATLINDTVIVGENHAGGEIGHISIEPDGPKCPCGKQGCLEMFVSAPLLRQRMYGASDEDQVKILQEAGQRVATALAMPIGLLDMDDICIYGVADIINAAFLNAAQQQLDRTTTSMFRKHATIRRCECGPNATIRGAAITMVRDFVNR
ncbi:ROK family transcriptional regulator [Bifidobacterium sp. ESL0704]|uniref:ROK family transcriptional regulator n=1 Tax=Bifidobacterium sp. ESL0704 TaxID=2983219 RepID=UPI0023F9214B|nr:ROK family transcriptional regulator [Bifidobacterium sp. ESL0704]WEV53217.1 ROK family transcriptional regulator [Bifidobacterium sp. ESL0704]